MVIMPVISNQGSLTSGFGLYNWFICAIAVLLDSCACSHSPIGSWRLQQMARLADAPVMMFVDLLLVSPTAVAVK